MLDRRGGGRHSGEGPYCLLKKDRFYEKNVMTRDTAASRNQVSIQHARGDKTKKWKEPESWVLLH